MFAKHPIEPNAIYTREEAAQCLGISLSTLKMLIRTGQLTVSQPLGMRRVLILGSSIIDMLQRTERSSSQVASAPAHKQAPAFTTSWTDRDFSLDSASRARQRSRAAKGQLAQAKPSAATGGANR